MTMPTGTGYQLPVGWGRAYPSNEPPVPNKPKMESPMFFATFVILALALLIVSGLYFRQRWF